MTPKNDLFRLIKSLNKTEKRYFKVFASKHSSENEKNYIRLFDFIDNLSEYDEKAVRDYFGNEKFTLQLSVTKNYLYKLILKALYAYHSENKLDSKINELIVQSQILSDKDLVEQSKQLLNKAKSLALRFERYNILLEIIHHEKVIRNKELHSGTFNEELDAVLIEEEGIIQKIQNINKFYNLTSKIFLLSTFASARSREDLQMFKDIINNPLYSNEDNALTLRSKLLYYDAKALYFRAEGNIEDNRNFRKKIIDLCESYPQLILEAPYRYIHAINNYLVSSHAVKKYDDFFLYLNKLKDTLYNKKIIVPNDTLWLTCYMHELGYYHAIGKYTEAENFIVKIESDLKSNPEKSNNLLSLYLFFNIVLIYIEINKYREALTWVNKILNSKIADENSDVYYLSRLVSLVIHFELGNIDLLEYILKSTYRYFSKRKKIYKIESVLLKYLRKSFRINNDPKELKPFFEELRYEIMKVSQDPFEKKLLDEFDIISWLDSKIQNKSFSEIIKERKQIN